MSQLTAVDAAFLNAETDTTHVHIAGVGILDPTACPGGRLTVADVADMIRRRAHLARPLRQRLARVPFGLDLPYWEDDPDFDPRRHILEIALPAPGGPAQLNEVVAMLHERPLDRSHPLWELALIQGLAGGRVAVYLKVHHAAIDGVMAAETLAAFLDLSPVPREVPADDEEPRRAPGPLRMLRTGLLKTALYPVRSAVTIARTAPYLDEIPVLSQLPGAALMSQVAQAIGREEMPPAPRVNAPPTPFNRPIGRRRAVACGELSLAEVKQVRRALGGSVNDVVMAICASALRMWLDKRGELPDRPLVVGVPVSLRRRGGAGEAGNQLSLMSAPLATHIADPADRYAAVRADMDAAKRRFVASDGAWVRQVSRLLPAPLAAPVTRLALQALPALRAVPAPALRPINLIISNVPGPQFPLYLCGARVLGYYPISVVTDISGGVNITVFSYDGKIDVGIVAARDLVPEPAEIVDHLRDALNELKDLADVAGLTEEQGAVVPRQAQGGGAGGLHGGRDGTVENGHAHGSLGVDGDQAAEDLGEQRVVEDGRGEDVDGQGERVHAQAEAVHA
ncbi:diacylglycerol O-acyltransferase [Actinomadura sp. NBRC 104425]|uniref:WS/DGAT/MGAT family O-acyltransferase n=1 Tax=Actinomadura sp. NBRC 104425 TaxID=3032204 RepID=UPI0024A0CD39|nr:wax ester/triacylglycerol synthase family O-acyltransferase [Actinomadura sp. NBRC 104425]GLZ13053.1 diacylglycerol O-acyltransferase [Actinomadura sp. NBRC 104425]